jgi:DNA-binding NarL/FixJ family response regulator
MSLGLTNRERQVLLALDRSRGLEPVSLSDVADRLGLSRKTVESHLHNARAKAAPRFRNTLTGRQREVSALVAKGYRNREIAATLNISENTVKRHLQQIFSRTGKTSRLSVAIAFGAGA